MRLTCAYTNNHIMYPSPCKRNEYVFIMVVYYATGQQLKYIVQISAWHILLNSNS